MLVHRRLPRSLVDSRSLSTMRPSWIATFVRRALERDPRFVVSGLDYPSRGIHISIGDAGALERRALDQERLVGGVVGERPFGHQRGQLQRLRLDV